MALEKVIEKNLEGENAFTRLMQKHKLVTFAAAKTLLAAVPSVIGYMVGSQIEPSLAENPNMLTNLVDYYPQAIAASSTSIMARIGMDATILAKISYESTKDDERIKQNFSKRYYGQQGLMLAFDIAISPLLLAGMLASNVSYGLAWVTHGKIPWLVSAPLQILSYKKIVLGEKDR